ncbi:MAG: TolC family protein [Endomicrobiales bacterium]|nr:TolC family protein [Endomicrobiales bacterium]
MNKKSISKFMVFGLIFSLTTAGHAKEYTWQELLDEANQHNPELLKARESFKKYNLLYKKTYSGYLPSLSASASASQSGSDSSDISKGYSYGLRGSLSVFSGFSDYYNVKSGSLDLRKSELSLQRAMSDIVYSLKVSYISLLWAQESVKLSQQILERRKNNYEMVRLKYEAGREDKGSLLRVEADKLQAEYDLKRAQRELKTASYELCEVLGKDKYEVIEISGNLSENADFQNMENLENTEIEKLAENVPEYLIAKYDVTLSRYGKKSAWSSFYPSLSLSSSLSNSGDQWESASKSWSAGVSLSYSLFSGGNDYYNLKIQDSNIIVARENFRKTSNSLVKQLQEGLNSYLDSVENIKIREKYLQASQEQSDVTTAKYINGLTTYYDWYSVENNYISSQKSYISAIREAVQSEARWQNLIGK